MDEKTRNRVVHLRARGVGVRSIARQLRVSRTAVSRVLRARQKARDEGSEAEPSRPGRPSKLDAYDGVLRELLERYPEITATRALEELTANGFDGKYTVLRLRLRELRPRPASEIVVRFETGPGIQSQMDYSTYTIKFTEEGPRKVHAFSYVLGYSRRQYLNFVEQQDFATTTREHVKAFTYFGGVTAESLYDNFKVVVLRWEDGEPVFNPRFLAFATHYGFRPRACLPRRAKTKGKVERPFSYVESNLLNGRSFRSLDHLNETTRWWLPNRADVRKIAELNARPIDRFADEIAHLRPLPACDMPTDEVGYRTVDGSGYIQYLWNFYSVPPALVGALVWIRVGEHTLDILDRNHVTVARHQLLPRDVRGQRQQLPEHAPDRAHRTDHAALRARYEELGPEAVRYHDALIESRHYGRHEARKILALLTTYSRLDLCAAIQHALRHRAFGSSYIERILAAKARPRPASEILVEEAVDSINPRLRGEAIKPRSGAAYQKLLEDAADGSPPTQDDSQGP